MEKTKNLKPPFNSKTAAFYGRKGGLVRSERKKIASAIRATKHGRYTKNKVVLKAITPSPVERAAGVTRDDKLALLKRLAPALATHEIGEALADYGVTLLEIKSQILRLEKEYERTEEEAKRLSIAKVLMDWRFKYADREWEFIKNVHGIGKPNFSLESTTESMETAMTLNQLMENVLGPVGHSLK